MFHPRWVRTAATHHRLLVIQGRLLFVIGWWLWQLIVLIEQVAGQLSSLPDLLLDPGLVSLLDLILKLLGEAFLVFGFDAASFEVVRPTNSIGGSKELEDVVIIFLFEGRH